MNQPTPRSRHARRLHNLANVLTLLLTLPFIAAISACADSGNWNANLAGNWSDASKWDPAAVPGTVAGDVVGLTFDITAARTVTLDTTPRTVGTLNIGDSATSFFAYTLAASGGAKLTFDNSGSGASLVQAVTTAADVISAPLILADNLSINNSSSLTLSGIISDGGAGKTLTKTGGGTLFLTGANSYGGNTTVSGGTVSFNTITNVGATSSSLGAPTTIEAGTLNVSGILIYTGAATTSDRVINMTGSVQMNNSGTGLLTLNGGVTGGGGELAFRGAQNITENGLIAHSGTVVHTDAGTLTLTNPTNSFPGTLGMKAGTISVNLVADAGTPSPIGAGTSLVFGQPASFVGFGKLQFTGTNGGSCNRAITIASPSGTASGGIIENTVAGQTLILSGDIGTSGSGPTPQLQLIGAGNGELSGSIGGSGLVVTKAGAGTWTLSGGNYGLGGTVVSAGVLKIGNPDALGSGAPVTANGGQLDLNAISPSVGGLSGGSGGLITNAVATPVALTFNNAAATPFVYAGRIQDGGAANAISINNAAGVQELTGTNSYSGTTTVAGGTLALGTVGAATNSPITVADGATLGLVVTLPGATFTPANLTLGNGSGATINCFLGRLGNPTAPLLAPGNLTVNGTLTFGISSDSLNLAPGQSFTLLQHPSAPSLATALGALPAGSIGHLVTNVPNSSIDLVLDCVGSTIWLGNNSSDWDINGTVNWTNNCAGAITYQEPTIPGAAVVFDDTAANNAVILTTTLSPLAVAVNNSVQNYSFSGPGAIAGAATLTKSGSATLTVANNNTYTGGTLINGGSVSIGDGGTAGSLGTGAIADNGTLVINRSDSPTISQLITGTGGVVLAGTGTVNLSAANTYSGGTLMNAGTFVVGVVSVNSGTTFVSGSTGMGEVTVANGVSFAQSGNRWSAPKLTLLGDITLLGNSREQVIFKTIDLSGGTRTIHVNATGGNLVQNIPGDTALEQTGRNRWELQDLSDAHANNVLNPPTITVTNGNLILDSNLTGNNCAGFMFQFPTIWANNVGLTVASNIYLQTWIEGGLGSTPTDTAKLTLNGIWMLDGSLPAFVPATNHYVYSLAGKGRIYASVVATAVNPRKVWILGTAGTTEFTGVLANGPGTGKLSLAKTGGSTQILSGVNPYSGSTTITGGTLALSGSGSIANSSPIDIGAGAMLDVADRTDQTLTLNSGQTLMGSGNLNGTLVALVGSTVNPGSPVGTLRVTNNITLGGTLLLELNRTNAQTSDQLVSVGGTITYGGTLVVTNIGPALQAGDVFHLFPGAVTGFSSIQLATSDAGGSVYTWNNKVTIDGSVELVTALNTNPAPITATISGNQLVLSWPADHTTWRLQAQTNGLDVGLSNNWVTIPNTELSNSYTNDIDPAQGSVFYRIVYP